ncbi:hypothetical protein MKX57_11245 [Lysinibacillus sp. FSL M8-0216]|uniref:hypothetical protein n=1 Tax=Lysinibacillus sp. FSL M8-0216 TaxID=2921619 RepID=UPI003159A155
MRISEIFNLNMTQRQLDFVNVNIEVDTPLFLDPYYIGNRPDNWSYDAHRTIESFFQHILSLFKSNNITRARQLFENLGEPNETCLGISTNRPNGRGIGVDEAEKVFKHLYESKVIQNNIVGHFEDLVIFVDKIGKDKISDLTTNIIRKHLIDYTISQCELLGIPLEDNVPTGFYWNGEKLRWENGYEKGLVIGERVIILVPKWAVSYSNAYTKDYYAQHFVLNFMQNEHLRLNTSLVRTKTTKKGVVKRRVYKKDLKASEPVFQKEYLREFTLKHPEVFEDFRKRAKSKIEPISNPKLSNIIGQEEIDIIDYLILQFTTISAGAKEATNYHRLVTSVLEYLFYPFITRPIIEQEIHDGRKRIDIVFDNSAEKGFFFDLHTIKKIPASYIFVECKNYTKDIKNPELDQIAGRFSLRRGKFGFIVFRDIDDFETLIKRCADTFNDDRGCIIPLMDEDLIFLLKSLKTEDGNIIDGFLKDRLRKIIMK